MNKGGGGGGTGRDMIRGSFSPPLLRVKRGNLFKGRGRGKSHLQSIWGEFICKDIQQNMYAIDTVKFILKLSKRFGYKNNIT